MLQDCSALIKAQPESITKQTGAACFSDLLEEPSLLVLLLLLLIFHYCLFPFSLAPLLSSCVTVWERHISTFLCVRVCVCVCVRVSVIVIMCAWVQTWRACACARMSHDVLNDNLSAISHFSLLMKHDAFLLLPLMEAERLYSQINMTLWIICSAAVFFIFLFVTGATLAH